MFKITINLILSIFTGIVAGFFSLLILEIINFAFVNFNYQDLVPFLFINEIGEELIKLFFILFILNLLNLGENNRRAGIIFSLLIGLGFGLFETFLIISSIGLGNFSGLFLVILVHCVTSLFLGEAVIYWRLRRKVIVPILFLAIAISFHIVYNLFASNFNQ